MPQFLVLKTIITLRFVSDFTHLNIGLCSLNLAFDISNLLLFAGHDLFILLICIIHVVIIINSKQALILFLKLFLW